MFDRERAEMAAGFAREFIRADFPKGSDAPISYQDAQETSDEYVDLGLRMADRIIAACTKAGAVVGAGDEAAL